MAWLPWLEIRIALRRVQQIFSYLCNLLENKKINVLKPDDRAPSRVWWVSFFFFTDCCCSKGVLCWCDRKLSRLMRNVSHYLKHHDGGAIEEVGENVMSHIDRLLQISASYGTGRRRAQANPSRARPISSKGLSVLETSEYLIIPFFFISRIPRHTFFPRSVGRLTNPPSSWK